MAVALAIKARDASSLKRAIVELTFSGTYTTNGEATTNGFKKDLSFSRIHMVHIEGGGAAATGVVAKYDYAADKILLFRTDQIDDTLEELPNATAIAQVLRAEFIGEGNN